MEAKIGLKGLYGWAAVMAVLGASVGAFVGPFPGVPLGILAGAAAAVIPFASWHWMLAKRRPWWAYVAVLAAKLGLLGGGFWWLGKSGVVPGGAFVIGMGLVLVGALAFGIEASRTMMTADRKGAA